MPESLGDYLMQVQRIMERRGWAVQGVGSDGDFPQFSYTVGLSKVGHPEVIALGLPMEVMHNVLNNVGTAVVEKHQTFQPLPGYRYDNIVENYAVIFRACSNRQFNVARRFFGEDIGALQLLWPDAEGRYPTDANFREQLKPFQPLIEEP